MAPAQDAATTATGSATGSRGAGTPTNFFTSNQVDDDDPVDRALRERAMHGDAGAMRALAYSKSSSSFGNMQPGSRSNSPQCPAHDKASGSSSSPSSHASSLVQDARNTKRAGTSNPDHKGREAETKKQTPQKGGDGDNDDDDDDDAYSAGFESYTDTPRKAGGAKRAAEDATAAPHGAERAPAGERETANKRTSRSPSLEGSSRSRSSSSSSPSKAPARRTGSRPLSRALSIDPEDSMLSSSSRSRSPSRSSSSSSSYSRSSSRASSTSSAAGVIHRRRSSRQKDQRGVGRGSADGSSVYGAAGGRGGSRTAERAARRHSRNSAAATEEAGNNTEADASSCGYDAAALPSQLWAIRVDQTAPAVRHPQLPACHDPYAAYRRPVKRRRPLPGQRRHRHPNSVNTTAATDTTAPAGSGATPLNSTGAATAPAGGGGDAPEDADADAGTDSLLGPPQRPPGHGHPGGIGRVHCPTAAATRAIEDVLGADLEMRRLMNEAIDEEFAKDDTARALELQEKERRDGGGGAAAVVRDDEAAATTAVGTSPARTSRHPPRKPRPIRSRNAAEGIDDPELRRWHTSPKSRRERITESLYDPPRLPVKPRTPGRRGGGGAHTHRPAPPSAQPQPPKYSHRKRESWVEEGSRPDWKGRRGDDGDPAAAAAADADAGAVVVSHAAGSRRRGSGSRPVMFRAYVGVHRSMSPDVGLAGVPVTTSGRRPHKPAPPKKVSTKRIVKRLYKQPLETREKVTAGLLKKYGVVTTEDKEKKKGKGEGDVDAFVQRLHSGPVEQRERMLEGLWKKYDGLGGGDGGGGGGGEHGDDKPLPRPLSSLNHRLYHEPTQMQASTAERLRSKYSSDPASRKHTREDQSEHIGRLYTKSVEASKERAAAQWKAMESEWDRTRLPTMKYENTQAMAAGAANLTLSRGQGYQRQAVQ